MPLLYSFRRCPYAIRARMALRHADLELSLREVKLADKPSEMLALSAKGTVPVLQLDDGRVLEESLDIIDWAYSQAPLLLRQSAWQDNGKLVHENDGVFKKSLDGYKYPNKFTAHSQATYREQGEVFLAKLNLILTKQLFLSGDTFSWLDFSIFPFIRQFAFVDEQWFFNAPYPKLQQWLRYFLDSKLFLSVMKKYEPWKISGQTYCFS